jgi:hypothetical protein
MITKEIGKNTLGSGKKMTVDMKTYNRSTHDMSYIWRNTQAPATLVPFMKKLALPGDITDIDLDAKVLTHPTVGPLYGSYKLQMDVFTCPIRLYVSALHNNSLKVGLNMAKVKMPKLKVQLQGDWSTRYKEFEQVNPSCLLSYLGINGFGIATNGNTTATYNAVPTLAYWDIFKNYYANKQEDNAYYISSEDISAKYITGAENASGKGNKTYYPPFPTSEQIYFKSVVIGNKFYYSIEILWSGSIGDADPTSILVYTDTNGTTKTLQKIVEEQRVTDPNASVKITNTSITFETGGDTPVAAPKIYGVKYGGTGQTIGIQEFPLSNIDDMREDVLQKPFYEEFQITKDTIAPYGSLLLTDANGTNASKNQFGLALKTYQSDIFNNWINTEWIDGTNGINDLTAVSTADGEFTIDALNIAQKVYNMLNRVALSDGTYRSWLETVYTSDYVSRCESPVYEGGMSQEIVFDEVVSTAATADGTEPLGSLAGRGKMADNRKGGRLRIKVDEPSFIIGIVSITPRLDYSQGNDWDVTLDSLDDLHKPELDAIGFQDLPASWMAWSESKWDINGRMTERSFGKQPAWIQYMTAYNKTKGNFAINNNEAFMVLNRNYEIKNNGEIQDATTYIDPTKFNYVFADTSLDAMNFWVQIAVRDISRRKMSAKVIPNL